VLAAHNVRNRRPERLPAANDDPTGPISEPSRIKQRALLENIIEIAHALAINSLP
jgi:hypothetical protein